MTFIRIIRMAASAGLACILGGGAASGLAGGLFLTFYYRSASTDYRDMVLVSLASSMFMLGGVTSAAVALLPRRSRLGIGCVAGLALLIIHLLCVQARATEGERLMIFTVTVPALVAAIGIGWLMQPTFRPVP